VQGNAQQQIQPNFYMLINTYLDNAPKVILGEYPNAETEIYANTNTTVKCSLLLSGSGSKFTYSFTVGNTTRKGAKGLTSADGIIRLDVISQPLKDSKDKVAVILDVDNRTNARLEIAVRNDDAVSPRFKLGKKTGEVIIK
jgi:hypothetical protein